MIRVSRHTGGSSSQKPGAVAFRGHSVSSRIKRTAIDVGPAYHQYVSMQDRCKAEEDATDLSPQLNTVPQRPTTQIGADTGPKKPCSRVVTRPQATLGLRVRCAWINLRKSLWTVGRFNKEVRNVVIKIQICKWKSRNLPESDRNRYTLA